MKLLAKFNLILGVVLGAGLVIAAAVSHSFLQTDARHPTSLEYAGTKSP